MQQLVSLRAITAAQRPEIQRFLHSQWGNTNIYSRGRIYQADCLSGFTIHHEEQLVGLATYQMSATTCDIITLNSIAHERGVGSALLEAVQKRAVAAHCTSLSLVVTNDNLRALRFYMRFGFSLVRMYPHSIDQARRWNPLIPEIGADGIPLHAELELALPLDRLRRRERP